MINQPHFNVEGRTRRASIATRLPTDTPGPFIHRSRGCYGQVVTVVGQGWYCWSSPS